MQAIRDLTASEIDCRVQSVKDNGLILLLYKNARVDMNILDETFGAENWQREHYECKGNLFCRVGIRFGNEWVWKADCGVESNTEAQKGEASDSFKRAGTNWGIGRELYTSPFIWVKAENCNISTNKSGKPECKDDFIVQSITIKDKVITALTIYNNKKKCVAYQFGGAKAPKKETPPVEAPTEEPKAPEAPQNALAFAKDELKRKVNIIKKKTEKPMKEITDKLLAACAITTPETVEDYEGMIAFADLWLHDLPN